MNEYPKQEGWHWYRANPDKTWRPVVVKKQYLQHDEYLLVFHGADGYDPRTDIKWTQPEQWGGRIEKPATGENEQMIIYP